VWVQGESGTGARLRTEWVAGDVVAGHFGDRHQAYLVTAHQRRHGPAAFFLLHVLQLFPLSCGSGNHGNPLWHFSLSPVPPPPL